MKHILLSILTTLLLTFALPAWSANPATVALQAQIDTGESITLPSGLIQIDDTLHVYSIGQQILGTGVNRTVIQQLTPDIPTFKLHRHEQGSVAAYTWRGAYGGGHGCHHITIGKMSIVTATASGVGIEYDDGTDWDGDFLHFHDLLTYGFETHILTNGIAHLRMERIVASNATAEQARWGTAIKCYGATPNSHVFDAITMSGFDIGADLLGSGLKGNFGDLGHCNIGLRLNGKMSITGGHFEKCDRYIDIGATEPSHIDLRGINLAVSPSNELHPIRVSGGSTLTGAAVRGAATKEIVECAGWYDHALLDNHPAGNDWSGPDYYFVNTAMGIRARFAPNKLVKEDAHLPTPSADIQGLTLRVFNAGNERLVTCVESTPGVFVWRDHW